MQQPSKDPHSVRGHRTLKEAAKERQDAAMKYAASQCQCPLPGGFACGQCIPCNLILNSTCQKDGLKDDWCDFLKHLECSSFRAMDNAFIYDFNPTPLLPGMPGAIYTIGVSQVAIFRPAPAPAFGFQSYNSLAIQTLYSPIFADFPTPASLAAGEFAIYAPYGFGIGITTMSGTTFGLSDVALGDVAVFSNTYASLADVPQYLMNSMWEVFGTPTATTVFLNQRSVQMYRTGWYMQTKLVMNSSTLTTADAFPGALLIETIVTPLSYWKLVVSDIERIVRIRFKYIAGVYSCKKRCGRCSDNPSRGCNGSRCGVVRKRAMIRYGNADDMQLKDTDSFNRDISNVEMLERALYDGEDFSGVSVHPKTFRVITSANGDNLSFCPKWVLKRALEVEYETESKFSHIPPAASEPSFESAVRYIDTIASHQQTAFVTKLKSVREARMLKLTPAPDSAQHASTAPVGSIWDGNLFGQ